MRIPGGSPEPLAAHRDPRWVLSHPSPPGTPRTHSDPSPRVSRTRSLALYLEPLDLPCRSPPLPSTARHRPIAPLQLAPLLPGALIRPFATLLRPQPPPPPKANPSRPHASPWPTEEQVRARVATGQTLICLIALARCVDSKVHTQLCKQIDEQNESKNQHRQNEKLTDRVGLIGIPPGRVGRVGPGPNLSNTLYRCMKIVLAKSSSESTMLPPSWSGK